MLRLSFLLLALLAQLAAAAHVSPLRARADILSPEHDPFYKPPSGWKDRENGAVLRSRKIKPALVTAIEMKVEHAYEILYRTTGTYDSDPSYTVTTVLVPYNAKRDKLAVPLTLINASGQKCVPSYVIRKGSELPGDFEFNWQFLLEQQILEHGYIVSLPDYQGPERVHPVGPLEGRQVLDSIKATISYDQLNLKKDTPVVTWGYSGAAVAAGWAAQLQPSYAPSINAAGFMLGGTPVNQTDAFVNQDNTGHSSWVFSGLVGISYAYPELLDWITPRLTQKGKKMYETLRKACFLDTARGYKHKKLFSEEYIRGGSHMLYEPVFQDVFHQLNLGVNKTLIPKAPVLMVHALYDSSVNYTGPLRVAKYWGSRGADVTIQLNKDSKINHPNTQVANIPTMILFMKERFANKPFHKGFHREYVEKPLEDKRYNEAKLEILVDAIKDILGGKIGPAKKKLGKIHTHIHLRR